MNWIATIATAAIVATTKMSLLLLRLVDGLSMGMMSSSSRKRVRSALTLCILFFEG
jgi:hypothetical protein